MFDQCDECRGKSGVIHLTMPDGRVACPHRMGGSRARSVPPWGFDASLAAQSYLWASCDEEIPSGSLVVWTGVRMLGLYPVASSLHSSVTGSVRIALPDEDPHGVAQLDGKPGEKVAVWHKGAASVRASDPKVRFVRGDGGDHSNCIVDWCAIADRCRPSELVLCHQMAKIRTDRDALATSVNTLTTENAELCARIDGLRSTAASLRVSNDEYRRDSRELHTIWNAARRSNVEDARNCLHVDARDATSDLIVRLFDAERELAASKRIDQTPLGWNCGTHGSLGFEPPSLIGHVTSYAPDVCLIRLAAGPYAPGAPKGVVAERDIERLHDLVRQFKAAHHWAPSKRFDSMPAVDQVLELLNDWWQHKCVPLSNPTREEAITALRIILHSATLFGAVLPDQRAAFDTIVDAARSGLPGYDKPEVPS